MNIFKKIIFAFALVHCSLSISIEQNFKDNEIVPDVLNIAPSKEIKVFVD